MKGKFELLALNRGIVSRLALARLDLKRMALSASEMVNWMPRSLGSMMLRPGLQFIGEHLAATKSLPFVFATDDTAQIEMSAGAVRVWVDDALVTRTAASATITNGAFTANIAGWTDQSDPTGSVGWASGAAQVTGDGTAYGILEQAVATGTPGVRHALRITVMRGPVILRVGSSSLGSQYLTDTTLGTGTHSIVIVPAGTFYIQFRNRLQRSVYVDAVAVEAAGVMTLPNPYLSTSLVLLRPEQSGDVVYVACQGFQQRKIERRDNDSWSIVLYEPDDGPFRVENVSPTTIAASAISGSGITLTASDSLFRTGHVGALFALTSTGQRVETTFGVDNVFSDPIRVAGIGESRRFAIIVAGTFVATITLQRSVGILGAWEDVTTYTAPQDITYTDGLDNQIIYFRLGIKAGGYTSGSATSILNYSSGSIRGVVRVTAYTSDLIVVADVLKALGGTAATDVWAEGSWSPLRGYPSSVRLHDGRLWWAGKDYFYGSVTDGFESFDPTYEGDAGPIQRSVGSGPIDSVTWMASLNRLVAGTDGAVVECRSSSLDEPLTPTNFTPKAPATKGSARVDAVKIDDMALFVQRSRFRVLQVTYTIQKSGADLLDLTVLAPDVCEPGIVMMAVQREPETRIHCVLADGTVAILIFDPAEDVKCWIKIETDGEILDAVVTPGDDEDAVYYTTRRTINGVQRFFYERFALESESRGRTWNKLADSFVTATSASTINLPHLEGETVVAWGSGRDLGTFVVPAGGAVNLGGTFTNVCVGLGYEARFKSTKLAYIVPPGQSGIGARKRINALGIVAADAHTQGLQYGRDFLTMDDLPMMEEWAPVNPDGIEVEYEGPLFEFPGEWSTDSRLCLRAAAPRPYTVLAAVVDMDTNPHS